ncbi:MAG: hypothetical protein NZL86_04070 [Aquificaceae bacterium]|nr:hypothetical protein [Aquificaceae bacterium]
MKILAVFLFLLFFFFYAFLFEELFAKHFYIHKNLLFFAEKALLALDGNPPRLENLGFVYPPVGFIPFILLREPLLVSAVMGSILSLLLVLFVLREKPRDILPLTLLLFNPLYVFLATQRLEVLTFYYLLVFSVFFAVLHIQTQYSLYAFISGILFGLTFFADFRSLYVSPFFALGIFLSTTSKEFSYRISLLMVKLTPVFFFLLGWLYLNWVFMEDPLHFVKSPYSFLRSEPKAVEVVSVSGSLWGSFKFMTGFLLQTLPLIFPYFVVLFQLRTFRSLYSIPLYIFYLLPVFFYYFSIYSSQFFPTFYTSVLFLLFALVFRRISATSEGKLFNFSMLVALLSAFFLPLQSKEVNERFFVRSFFGAKVDRELNLEEDIRVSTLIKEYNCKKTLADDAYSFPVVYFSKEPKRFVLQYNYEFYTYMSNPWLYADCLLLFTEGRGDALSLHFHKARQGFLQGYYLVYQGGKYMFYRRVGYDPE